MTCLIQSCCKPIHARGYCDAHYRRLRAHGDPLGGGTARGELMRFINEVVLPYEGNECIPWPYANTKGYGMVSIDGKHVLVSRYVCELVNGPPPTPAHQAAHSCGKGHEGCVTKGHLDWKTPAQNQADKLEHGTDNRGERHGMAKLTEAEAREILAMKGKETKVNLARRFGVSRTAVHHIHTGFTWAWISEEAKGVAA